MAQEPPKPVSVVDSVVYRPAATLDSTLVGKSIFSLLPLKSSGGAADVKVFQSQGIIDALRSHISYNPSRKMHGFRVRIFFDNSQTARGGSESAAGRFAALYHGIPVYRTHQNPFFKVTVGDFRTRSEAVELLERVKYSFPSAFIVKETINYPAADRARSYVADTVKVYKHVEAL